MVLRGLAKPLVFLVLVSGTAWAQGEDDDLLAPLSPVQKAKPKKKAKPKVRAPKAAPQGEDLLAPLVPSAPPTTGDLVLKLGSPVKGARLFVDDKEVGLVGSGPVQLAPGEHLVSVRRPGFADFTKRVNLSPGKVLEVNVTLEAVAAIVVVSSDTVGAQVLIDGRLVGTTPLPELLLSPGIHDVVVKKEGVGQDAQRIVVRAGREHSVSARIVGQAPVLAAVDRPERSDLAPPEPSPVSNELVATGPEVVESSDPLYKRWYVWAGAAAVVAAAVVGGVAAANSRPSGDPTCQQLPPPTTACEGECDYVMNYPSQGPQ